MTSHEYQQCGDCRKSSDISIDKIVNKEEYVEEWETSCAWNSEGKGKEECFHSLPSISQLCFWEDAPLTKVESFSQFPPVLDSQESKLVDNEKEQQQQQQQDNGSYCTSTRQETNQTWGHMLETTSQGTSSSLNSTSNSKASRKSDENSKAKRQMAKKLWRQRDQMKKEEEKLIFQKKEESFQAAIWAFVQSHSSEWNEDKIRQVSRQLFQTDADSTSEWKEVENMPVLHGSAYDLITKQRHRIEKRLPPGTLEQLPEEEIKKRRNEQKSASKWRAMQLQMEKMHLLRWNCRILEEVYKYMRRVDST